MAGGAAVAVVLLVCLGGANGSHMAGVCGSSETVVGEGSQKTVFNETYTSKNKVSSTVYVRPGSDFKGISLQVNQSLNSSVSHDVWFAADDCYKDDTKWTQLKVDVDAKTSPKHVLDFKLHFGSCTQQCRKSDTGHYYYYIRGLSIVAHGSSSWTSKEPPKECLAAAEPNTKQDPNSFDQSSACSPLPTTTTKTTTTTTTTTNPSGTTTATPTNATATAQTPGTTTTPRPVYNTTIITSDPTTATPTATTAPEYPLGTAIATPTATQRTAGTVTPSPPPSPQQVTESFSSTVAIIVAAAVVAAVVVASAGVCVICRRRRRREQTSVVLRQQSRAAQPSVHVHENSLYEPFSNFQTPAGGEQQGTVEVIENSLYEPFSNFQTPASREQQGTVEVIENSLYEPFSNFQTPANGAEEPIYANESVAR